MEELDLITENAVTTYGEFEASLYGLFSITTKDHNAQRRLSKFSERSDALLLSASEKMWTSIENDSRDLFTAAMKSAGGRRTDEMDALVASAVSNTMHNISRQMLKSIGDATLDIKRLIITAARIRKIAGQTDYSAFIAARRASKLSYIDNSGKQSASDRYIRSVVRSHFIGLNADAFAIAAISLKKKEIILSNGEAIFLSGYAEMREKYLHPNTKVYPVYIK